MKRNLLYLVTSAVVILVWAMITTFVVKKCVISDITNADYMIIYLLGGVMGILTERVNNHFGK